MGVEELHTLCEGQTKDLINRNIERKHNDVALDKSLSHSSLIATQVKYLQRAHTKLPSYYAARCIIPPRAFEQSSSEATAAVKRISGGSVLELTCGLGVDAYALSKSFERVVTCERDEVLAAVARENFHRLGVTNIEVVTGSAEEYLAGCEEHFDWIYADPDRRDASGAKRVVLEDCSPNIIALRGELERVAERVMIKCSPIFDVEEAFRLFPRSRVDVVSMGDECKEVVIYTNSEEREMIGAIAIGRGEVVVERSTIGARGEMNGFDTERYSYLIIPDVALQKSRLARHILSEVAYISSDNGYAFCDGEGYSMLNPERHLGRVERIDAIFEYGSKELKQELSRRGIKRAQILKRNFPHSIERITKQLKIGEGGGAKLAFTEIGGRLITIILTK